MLKLRWFPLLGLAALLASSAFAQSPGQAQGPGKPAAPVQTTPKVAFRATNYQVHASLDPIGQVITARATVDFMANGPSRQLDVELHPNLRVNAVRDGAGRPVIYDRDDGDPLKLHVTLADMIPAGGKVTLDFDYNGPLASDDNSPSKGVRLAYVGRDGAYLLLPARWFPLTDFPANRYTGVFQIEVPGTMVVVGTGTPSDPVSVTPKYSAPPPVANSRSSGPVITTAPPPPPSMENERMLYTFRVDKPTDAGTFVASPLQLSPVAAEGLNFAVFTPAAQTNTAQAYAQETAQAMDYFNSTFGALPQQDWKIAQLPDGTVPAYSAPGLLLISARQWSTPPNTRLLANLAAQQWWGNGVMAASSGDVWVTAGLARYSEGLYAEQNGGKDALNKALEDFAVGALMFDDAAPIAESQRLDFGTDEYISVVVNKGAMVFHMLRALMGDAGFTALIKDFYTQYAGKSAHIEDLEKMAEARAEQAAPPAPATFTLGNAPPAEDKSSVNLRPFFTQWLRSTGVPEFSLEYIIYRTKKGFRLVGKAKQALDFFHMDVEIEVQTEGNPEFKTIEISGTESPFSVETFGRPKPNGIILDPHNFILKSSPRLRTRAIIARGEGLAEEGKYYDAVQQYQRALDVDRTNALADFRMGEAFFYERNYAASAQSFRDALDGAADSDTRWTEVWSHIYLGRIYDIQGDRTRAVNEYSKGKQTGDDTGGAQAEIEKSVKKPDSETGA